MTTVLAIETSCDETAVAVARKEGDTITVLADGVASQTDIHALTGGVVPEAAAREHVAVLRPMLEKVTAESGLPAEALAKAGISNLESGIDAIAVTYGPGLQPALAVGVTAAQTLAYAWNKPLVPVHHLEGHLYSALLRQAEKNGGRALEPRTYNLIPNQFPALGLVVSGGHTMLVLMRDHVQYEVLGSTRDDAAGEAFDKVARLLGLPYPGGPEISRLAERGNPRAFSFARPMLQSGDLDFSFSGLKTEVLYTLRDLEQRQQAYEAADIAASFQAAVVETLVGKAELAVAAHEPAVVLLAGGVAANSALREQMATMVKRKGLMLRIAPLALCGDNAVMIAQAGLFAFERGRQTGWRDLDAHARIPLAEMTAT